MSIAAASLITRIGVEGSDAAKREVNSFSDNLRNASKAAGVAGTALSLGVTAPLIGLATAAISAGTALNQELGNVQSLGVTQARVVELKGVVQDLAIETGKGTVDIAQGLYQVISAFGDSADTAAILGINAKAAAAGLATVTDAIALTSAVTKGYGDTSAEAVQRASDLAFVTVQLGQTTFPELAQSIGKVVPLTSALGVAQEELFAVMATATGVTGSASEVATQLRGVMQSLMAPTATMTDLLEQQGVATGAALLAQEGLAGTIGLIVAAAEASGTPLQQYISSIEGQTLALSLAGPLADAYTQKLDAMTKSAGATDAAFAAQTQGINAAGFAAQQAAVKWEVFLQKLDEGLAPTKAIVIDALTPMMDQVLAFADSFAKMEPAQQQFIVAMAGIAAAAGPALLAISAVTGAVASLSAPMLVVGAAVAVFAAAWASDWGGIQEDTAAAVAAIKPYLDNLKTWLSGIDLSWNGLLAKMPTIQGQTQSLSGVTSAAIGQLESLLTAVLNFTNLLVTGIDTEAVASAATTFVQGFADAITSAIDTEGLTQLGDAAGALIGSFVTKLTELLGQDKFGALMGVAMGGAAASILEGAGALAAGIATQLGKTDWASLAENVISFSTGFLLSFAGELAKGDYAPLAVAILTGLGNALRNIMSIDPFGAMFGTPGAGMPIERGATGAGLEVAPIPWGDIIKAPDWEALIPDIIWEDHFPAFKWGTFVPALAWNAFVIGLSWGEFVKDINWGSFIPDISWGAFIPHINWGAFIPSLFGGGGASNSSSGGAAPGSGVPGDPLLATPIAPSPWDPPAVVASLAGAGGPVVQFTGPVSINNMGDIEHVADMVIAAIRRRG